jgi:hypothetical protein
LKTVVFMPGGIPTYGILFSKWLLFNAGRQNLAMMRRGMRWWGMPRMLPGVCMSGKTRVRR